MLPSPCVTALDDIFYSCALDCFVEAWNQAGEHGKQRVFFQHETTGFKHSVQSFFVSLVTHALADDFKAQAEITDVQMNEAFFGEIIENIRAAKVEGQTATEKGVGEFFSPVMRGKVVLDS